MYMLTYKYNQTLQLCLINQKTYLFNASYYFIEENKKYNA